MGLLKILERRYPINDDLSSFCMSGENQKKKGGMSWSMIKAPRSWNTVFDVTEILFHKIFAFSPNAEK